MVKSGGHAAFSQLVMEIAVSKQFRTRLGRKEDPAPVKIAARSAMMNHNQGVGR
jgi:hypothetical protein